MSRLELSNRSDMPLRTKPDGTELLPALAGASPVAVNVGAIRGLLGHKLRRLAAAAAISNPIDNPAATGVTVTQSASQVLTGTVQSLSALAQPQCYRFRGGAPTAFGTLGYRFQSVTIPTGTSLSCGWSTDFMVDSAAFDVVTSGSPALKFRFLINDRLVNAAGTLPVVTNGGLANYWHLDFGGVRAIRKITVQGTQSTSFNGTVIGRNDRVWQPNDTDALRIAIYGDSYAGGTGTTSNNAAAVGNVAAALLFGGNADTWQIALGGTGYVADGTTWRFASHLNDLLMPAAPFDVVIVAGGLNDKGQSGLQAAALSFFQGVRSRCPDAVIVVLGPWPANNNLGAPILAVEDAISAAVAGFADANTFFIPVNRAVPPWLKGDGYVNAPTGNGPSDIYLGGADGSDAVHPYQDAGHIYFGRLMADAIRAYVLGAV